MIYNNIILDTKNVNYNPDIFLSWLKRHPNRFSNYLNRKLKDIEIVPKNNTTYLYGDNYQSIDINNINHCNIEDFITINELLEKNIVTDPIFIVQANLFDDPYALEQRIIGITDNYDDALTIAKTQNDATIDIAKKNKPIDIYAGSYIE